MYGVFFVLLCIACVQDVRRGKISNMLVVSVWITGIFYACFVDGQSGVMQALIGMGAYLAVLYPLFKMGVLGAGDVKLMVAMAGVFRGEEKLLYFVWVWILAAAISLVKMLYQGNALERLEYFFSYVRDLVMFGEWQFYHQEREQLGKRDRSICMSVPMLIGFMLCVGG